MPLCQDPQRQHDKVERDPILVISVSSQSRCPELPLFRRSFPPELQNQREGDKPLLLSPTTTFVGGGGKLPKGMASVLAGSGKPILSEFTSDPNATNGRGRSESARLTIPERQAQEHKPMALTLRRQAVIGMTASVAAILLPPPSEAKVSKAENKKKVMEKLRQLREKAGLIEPKKENSSTGEVEGGEKIAPLEVEKSLSI